MEQWVHQGCHGGRAKHDSTDAAWDLQAAIELATLRMQPLSGVLLDYSKFFRLFRVVFGSCQTLSQKTPGDGRTFKPRGVKPVCQIGLNSVNTPVFFIGPKRSLTLEKERAGTEVRTTPH